MENQPQQSSDDRNFYDLAIEILMEIAANRTIEVGMRLYAIKQLCKIVNGRRF